ncbi:EamA-like transporter family [Musa troglodytarum]|uniref:EamA-like transporter family n=1 Tax=Musa troglodytarum TaxID=320322 RepID=A0A9E7K0T2_9LILI|nr:EamA-like transporter family [Musa troglodytarum]
MGGCGEYLRRAKPYIAMISLQFGYAGMNIITKVSLTNGMSHYVLVVYRHAFATLSIFPFALFLERYDSVVLISCHATIMESVLTAACSLLPQEGAACDDEVGVLADICVGTSRACDRPELVLPWTQVDLSYLLMRAEQHLAGHDLRDGRAMQVGHQLIFLLRGNLCFAVQADELVVLVMWDSNVRMEKVDLKKVIYQAKVAGTLVTVAGAMLMTLYKGPLVEMVWTKHVHPHASNSPVAIESSSRDWLLGSIFVILATLAWASLFVLQAVTLRKYSAQLSLTTWICFVGTLQAIAVTFVMERKPSAWTIGFDMNLLAAAYAGIVTSSVAYYVQGLVIAKRGPVFASAFSPLMMIIVAIMGSFILNEKIYLGGVLGAILIVVGLYSVLWGKYKENKEKKEREAMSLPVALKEREGCQHTNSGKETNGDAKSSTAVNAGDTPEA